MKQKSKGGVGNENVRYLGLIVSRSFVGISSNESQTFTGSMRAVASLLVRPFLANDGPGTAGEVPRGRRIRSAQYHALKFHICKYDPARFLQPLRT